MRLRELASRLPKRSTNPDVQNLVAALASIFRQAAGVEQSSGSWTPAMAGSSTAGTQTYGYRSGTYIKTGRAVAFEGALLMSAKDGTTSGDLRITGLPFTAAAGPVAFSVAIGQHQQFALSAGYTQVTAAIQGDKNYIELKECGDSSNSTNLTDAALAATSSVWVSGVYFV